MDVFSSTEQGLRLVIELVNKASVAAKAEKTVRILAAILEDSRERVAEIRRLFCTLSPDENVQALVNRTRTKVPEILQEYDRILNELSQYITDKKLDRSFQRGFDRSWKGLKWVLDESWIHGRIAELQNQKNRLDESLRVFDTYQGLVMAEIQQNILQGLEKIGDRMAMTQFLAAVSQLPIQHESSAEEKLHNMRDSPPTWILDEQSFRVWQEAALGDNNPWLWVLGEAGAGKSHAATFLAQHLLSSDQDSLTHAVEEEECHHTPLVGVGIYYCSFKAGDNQKSDQILGCLLRQLLHQLWEVAPQQAIGHMESVEVLTRSIRSNMKMESTHSILGTVSRSFDTVYLFVDGLDELPEMVYRDLIPKLRKLNSPGARIILTSRDGLRKHAEHLQASIINANNNTTSITAFVRNKMKRIAVGDEDDIFIGSYELCERLNAEAELQQLSERIVQVANQNFLCADLLIKQFYSLDPEGIDDALNNLVDGLDELIKKIMERIGDDRTGQQALLWTIYTVGSGLKLVQLQHALAFSTYSNNSNLATFRSEKLIKSTSYFLNIGADSEFVTIHKAVKDYFANARNARTHFEDAHGIIARTCLGCIEKSREDAGSLDQWKIAVGASPFLEYAATNWGWHLQRADEKLPNEPFPQLSIFKLLDRNRFLDTITIAIHDKLQELGFWKEAMWSTLDTEIPPLSALHILAYFNLPVIAEKWIELGNSVNGFENPSPDQAEHTPLYVASKLGNHEVVEILLSKGADPGKPNGSEAVSAFRIAVIMGHEDVVDTILEAVPLKEKQNLVSKADKQGGTALTDACGDRNHQGNLKIVQKILKVMRSMSNGHEILLAAGGPFSHTVLHLAAEANEPEIIRALLNFPGGRDLLRARSGGQDDTALIVAGWACWKGASNAVRCLLEEGADTSDKNLFGDTATHNAAAAEGHIVLNRTEGFRFLLEKSDISIKNNAGETPLHVTCKKGRPYHVIAMLPYLNEKPHLLFSKDNNGNTPIAVAATFPELNEPEHDWERTLKGKVRCIEELLPAVADSISIEDAEKILLLAQKHAQAKALVILLRYFKRPRELLFHSPNTSSIVLDTPDLVEEALNVVPNDDPEGSGLKHEGGALAAETARPRLYAVSKVLIEHGAVIQGDNPAEVIQGCIELCSAEAAEAIWALEPNVLLPPMNNQNLLNLASARNPVREIWCKNHLVPDNEAPAKEIECLRAERTGPALVVGDEGTAASFKNLSIPDFVFLGVHQGAYLESGPIPATAKIPMSKLQISITGKDQGWSDHKNNYPWDQGSFNGSETWFQIAIKRDGNIFMELQVTKNALNAGGWTTYDALWDVDKGPLPVSRESTTPIWDVRPDEAKAFVNAIRRGDRLCITPRAQYQGWQCWIRDASIRVYYED